MSTDTERFLKEDRDHDAIVAINERVNVIQKSYISREEFSPVQRIVYGIVSAILMAICAAILTLVLKK